MQLDAFLANVETRSEETDKAFVLSLSDYDFDRNLDELSSKLGLTKKLLKHWRPPAQAAGKKPDIQQGRGLSLPDITPADESQSGPEVLDDVALQVRRFVVADDSSIVAISLWAVFAHLAHDAPCCPNLVFSSAVKACGKSTALDVVSRLIPKPLTTSNVSPAALFRTAEKLSPTLVIDEADSMFRNNDDLRTLVNAGFTKTAATVVRLVGDDLEPRLFSVYCPKVIALIGTLPDTIESRSIVIRMRRRLPNESIDRLRSDKDQNFIPLVRRIARWVFDNKHVILAEEPELPEALSDRQADVWRELARIANVAGGDWPVRAQAAALELCAKADDGDISTRLLSDIQRIFADNTDRMKWPSQALADNLNAIEEAPWAEFGHGKGLTVTRLARMLAKFDIKTKIFKVGTGTSRGYVTESFTETFSRYLPPKCNLYTNGDKSIRGNNLESYTSVTVTALKCNRNQTVANTSTYTTMEYNTKVTGYTLERSTEEKKVHSGGHFPDWPAIVPQATEPELDIF